MLFIAVADVFIDLPAIETGAVFDILGNFFRG
jgi:hypothetical protein